MTELVAPVLHRLGRSAKPKMHEILPGTDRT